MHHLKTIARWGRRWLVNKIFRGERYTGGTHAFSVFAFSWLQLLLRPNLPASLLAAPCTSIHSTHRLLTGLHNHLSRGFHSSVCPSSRYTPAPDHWDSEVPGEPEGSGATEGSVMAKRQLRELQRLMAWSWDSRFVGASGITRDAEVHPPQRPARTRPHRPAVNNWRVATAALCRPPCYKSKQASCNKCLHPVSNLLLAGWTSTLQERRPCTTLRTC